jgi:hypothetical protein
MSVKARLWGAWILLVVCLVGWPVSVVSLAKEEPPFVLSLSWLALILTAIDIIFTADVRKKEEERDS